MIFITFEGCDGAGKTTLAEAVTMDLFKRGYSVQSGYAPSFVFTPYQMARLTPAQAATLFFDDLQSRERDFDEIPERTILLQDRWAESTYIYQGLVGAATDGELRDDIYKRARQMTAPDLTVFLPVSPQVAAKRIHTRDGVDADIDRLTKIIAAYDRIYCAGLGIWDQRVYRPSAHATFDEIVSNVANLAIDKWEEKYGAV
jgi:dTMP kinase